MKDFFGDSLLLSTPAAEELYQTVKDLPIIDYHCHLNEKEIADDHRFSDLGELWLAGDHYKWRAMRLCGVDEYYITGKASFYEKYLKYAEIFPQLAGNPLYYWTQLELKMLFNITEPLCKENADRIWNAANERLRTLSVSEILKQFRVEYIATTDDPASPLSDHGVYGNTRVCPTFRPDSALNLDVSALQKLADAAGIAIETVRDLKVALCNRLSYFQTKGCRIADHGFDFLPMEDCGEKGAAELFLRRDTLTSEEKAKFFSHMLYFLAGKYAETGITMQLHFATFRNINSTMFKKLGRDTGYDVMRDSVHVDRLAAFLDTLNGQGKLPHTVLYTLNPSAVPAMAAISGAFPNVRVGAAWWFNDTVLGIRHQLETVAEYAALGTNLGMLTDSRSFASYVRFDFFRRILAEFVGGYVERGEYDMDSAKVLMRGICYENIKQFLGL